MEQLAVALYCTKEFDRALQFLQAMKVYQQDGSLEGARMWNDIGCVQFQLNRVSFALHCWSRSIQVTGSDDRTRAVARANLGRAQLTLDVHKDQGQESLQRALSVSRDRIKR